MMTETVVNVQEAPNNNAAKTNAQSDGGGQLSWLKINLDHFRIIPGQLKIVQVILGILCMALASPARLSGTHWFLFVVTISFIGTLIWIFVYLLSIREALKLPIDWVLSELVNTGICAALYCIAFLVQIIVWAGSVYPGKGANITAGVFGLLNTLAYGYGTSLLHREWKSTTN